MPEIARNLKGHLSVTQTDLVLALKIVSFIAAILTIFLQDLTLIFIGALQNETASYVLVIPFIFAYMIYRKREMLRAVMPLSDKEQPRNVRHLASVSGILLATIAVLLYWYGSYTLVPLEYHLFALPIFAAGLCLILFNPQTLRQLAFPIAFLFFLTPPPSGIIHDAGSTLQVLSAEASNAIMNVFHISSMLTTRLGTPFITIIATDGNPMQFSVDIACLSAHSLVGFLVFAAFVAFVVRNKLWKKAAIFIVGFLLIYFLNIFRTIIILLIGYQWGQQLALDIFHLLGEWILILVGIPILLAMSKKLFKTHIFTKKQTQRDCPKCNLHPTHQVEDFCFACGRLIKYPHIGFRKIDAAKIVAIVLVPVLLMSIRAPVFALTQGEAQILIETPIGQRGNAQILPKIPNYTLQYPQRETDPNQPLEQDFSLVYKYAPRNSEKETIWIGLEIAQNSTSLYHWEFCLVTLPQTQGRQPLVEQLDLRDVQILQNPSTTARYFAFKDKRNNQTQIVLYWYENAIFITNNTSQQKYLEISLIAYANSTQDIPNLENELLPFATAIVNYWQPVKTWAAVAITLSRNGIALVEITVATLATIIIFYTSETVKKRRANATAYQKLSSQNKQIIDIIEETEKTTKPTLRAIADTYRSKTGLQIEENELLQRLSETEKTGIAKSVTANVQDEPSRIWTTENGCKIRALLHASTLP